MSSVHLLKNHPTTGATTSSTTIPTTAIATCSSTATAPVPLPSGIKGESFPQASYQEVVENAEVFMETLKALHGSLGTKFMVPTLGGRNLDLHLLFVEVTARGGLEQVIRNRQWKEIIAVFNFPPTITNASFVLRKYYISLLHHYEQIYYFRPENQPIMTTMVNVPINPLGGESSGLEIQAVMSPSTENGTVAKELPANSEVWTGRWVTGTIDGKFDCGYLVTVSIGSEKLQGVLYHVPEDPQVSSNINTSIIPRRRRRRSRRSAADPNRPKPNRSGYNFFFSEHYARLKSSHGLLSKPSNGHEKTISTTIGNLWSELTETEKQVYRDRGLRDKERYRRELLEYKKTSNGSKSQ